MSNTYDSVWDLHLSELLQSAEATAFRAYFTPTNKTSEGLTLQGRLDAAVTQQRRDTDDMFRRDMLLQTDKPDRPAPDGASSSHSSDSSLPGASQNTPALSGSQQSMVRWNTAELSIQVSTL